MKCIDDDIPFEIPEGWEWCRLKTISIIQEGPGIRSFQYTTKGVQLLTVTNILEGAVDLQKSQKYISSEEYTNKYLHFQLNKGDIVCACSGGSWGKSAIFDLDNKQIILNTSTLRLRFYGDLGCNGFLYHLTKSSFFKLQLAEQLSGMQPNFGYAHYSKILIPLPPIQEQMRIKSKINELLPPLSKYTHAQDKLDRLNASIKPSLKKAVLQEAIQGKLVPQDPNDEPASVLLERIREDKQRLLKEGKLKKKDITDSIIFKGEDNKYYEKVGEDVVDLTDLVPFEIPDNWEWVRLRDICSICTGATFKKEEATQDQTGVRVLRGGNISPLRLCYKDDDIFISGSLVKENILLNKNDIVTPAVTSLENIGKMARVESNLQNVTVGGFVFILRPFFNDDVMSKYLLAVMSSPSTIEYMRSITNKSGQAFYNIGKERLATTLIPLPPHNEQKCITDKLNHLFSRL